MSQYHTPVMLHESVSALVGNPSGIYADATFGGGGHTAHILSRLNDGGRVIAFDRDGEALSNRIPDQRLTLIHNNFRYIQNYRLYLGIKDGFDGILADLGVSSHQFDTAGRGFSFRFDAPLDMRMDNTSGRTAADIVNSYDEKSLERILRMWGEVDGASRIARLIVKARLASPILTTGDLGRAIGEAIPENISHKILSKIYQALRIEVNAEMRSLEKFLEGAAEALKEGGRLVVITYHSLEDRMVKNFMRTAPLKPLVKKPMLPSEEEISENTRARSAKLRIALKEGEAE